MKPSIASPATPRWVQTAQWILNPTGYMKINHARFGDFYQASIFGSRGNRTYILSDPKALQLMLTSDTGKIFSSPGEYNTMLASLLGDQGTILLSGQQHRQRRQLVMPRFHGDILKEYAAIIERFTRQEIAQWPEGEEINIRTMMQRITMRIILRVVFGIDQTERHGRLQQLLSQRLDLTATPLTSAVLFFPWLQNNLGPWSPGARMEQLGEETDKLLFAEIRTRREEGDNGRRDVLSMLITARDDDGQAMTDQELRDELMTLLVAGHETTATALTSAIYWLYRGEESLAKLQRELDSIADEEGCEAMIHLPYLTAVTQEALRIHPVAMLTFPRRVEQPVELCGHQLSPGDVVIGSIYMLHQKDDLYPQPEKFRPERFLKRQYSPYEYMPFGAGVRRCVGMALAQYEMKIVLGTLVRQLNLTLCNQTAVRPARRGVTLGHAGAVRMRNAGPRTPAAAPKSASPAIA